MKNAYSRVKLKSSLKKLHSAGSQIVYTTRRNNMIFTINILKKNAKRKKGCQKIMQSLNNFFLSTKRDSFRNLAIGPYSLTITSPSGMRKNMGDISIDVSNINHTSVVHSGNTSTSNVKNILSRSGND